MPLLCEEAVAFACKNTNINGKAQETERKICNYQEKYISLHFINGKL